MLLHIQNLTAEIEGTPILKGLQLGVQKGEIHAIMGPNGAGKSTLAQVLSGNETYAVTSGQMMLDDTDITELSAEIRARAGLFVSFQHPPEIPGVLLPEFLRASYNEKRKYEGLDPLDAFDFQEVLERAMQVVDMGSDFLARGMNEGFSGGEKKRNEILQMALLSPKVAILDEIDSGLDVDALRVVSQGINSLKKSDNAVVLITHYNRILDHITPDVVHIFYDGRIIHSGTRQLALQVEQEGYEKLIETYVTQQS